MIEAKNMPFVRQMIVGVLTEKSVTMSSTPWPDYTTQQASRKDLPSQMVVILENFNEMKKRDMSKMGNRKVPLPKIRKVVMLITEVLKESDKRSMVCFVYKNAASGVRSQEIFVELALHCLKFVDFIDQDLKENYYEIMSLVFHRGELDLDQVGFAKSESDGYNAKLIASKEKLAVKYQYLIYQSLNYCIEKLTRKSVDFYRKDYIVFNTAIAYFKVPEFRKAFLKAILIDGIPEITEFRNTHFDMNQEDHEFVDKDGDQQFVDNFFNWDKNFYSRIPDKLDQKKKNLEILSKILTNTRWEEKISKTGVALFLIITDWLDYAKNTIVNNKIEWWGIPGYMIILKVIVHQIKQRNILEYPDSLIDCSCSLVANENIMYVLIDIIFKKTNIHIPGEVKRTMEIIEKWFKVVGHSGKVFPANFDYSFFNNGIEMLIDYDHAISTPKCLWLIYKIFHIFPLHQQLTLTKMLFEKRFGSLFFSWSWNIRNVYNKLLLYQLVHVYGKNETEGMDDIGVQSGIKRVKSSSNLRFDKINLLSKSIKNNVTTTAHSLMRNENDKIIKITKIAVKRKIQILALVEEFESTTDFYYYDYLSEYSDSQSLDESEQEDIIDPSNVRQIIQSVPDMYKPYIGKAIEDYLKERDEYLVWDSMDEEYNELPEIVLQAVLDETENPDPIDGNEW
jgi:hypothetical protein